MFMTNVQMGVYRIWDESVGMLGNNVPRKHFRLGTFLEGFYRT